MRIDRDCGTTAQTGHRGVGRPRHRSTVQLIGPKKGPKMKRHNVAQKTFFSTLCPTTASRIQLSPRSRTPSLTASVLQTKSSGSLCTHVLVLIPCCSPCVSFIVHGTYTPCQLTNLAHALDSQEEHQCFPTFPCLPRGFC